MVVYKRMLFRKEFPPPSSSFSSDADVSAKKRNVYGNCVPINFSQFGDAVIGDFSAQLREETLDKATCLEAVKSTFWIAFHLYQNMQDKGDPTLSLVRVDILETILLTLHPQEEIRVLCFLE